MQARVVPVTLLAAGPSMHRDSGTTIGTPQVAALAAGAILLLFGALALALPGEASAAASSKVLSPKSGSVLPARPHVLRVKTGKEPKVFRAHLNGDSVAKHFSRPSKRGVSRLRASRSFGLRHGRNALRVHLKHGRAETSSTVRFRVRRNRPLAAAGKVRTVRAGGRIYLDGGRSRSHLKPNRDDLDHRWEILGAGKRGLDDGVSLSDEDTPEPAIDIEEPGTYRMQLTVTAEDGAVGTDRLTIQSVNPPFASVDTMPEASGGPPAIKVGETSYPADAGTSANPAWFQVLVLDRKTLVQNQRASKTYLCNRTSGGLCNGDQLQKDMAALDDRSLVIAANHLGSPGWAEPGFISFGRIGAKNFGTGDLPNGVGSFSAIGTPGDKPGEGTWHLDRAAGSGGRITGSLIRDNINNYTFLSPRVDFDTQAAGSTDSENVVTVGDQDFTVPLSLDAGQNGAGGFQVVVLDRMKLQQDAQTYWFPTGMQNFDSGHTGRINQMTARLRDANNADKVVIVTSRGNPALQVGREDQQDNLNKAVQGLVDQIEALGRDPHHRLSLALARGRSFRRVIHADRSFEGRRGAGHRVPGHLDDPAARHEHRRSRRQLLARPRLRLRGRGHLAEPARGRRRRAHGRRDAERDPGPGADPLGLGKTTPPR